MTWDTAPSILNVVVSPAVAEAHLWMPFMEIKNKQTNKRSHRLAHIRRMNRALPDILQ